MQYKDLSDTAKEHAFERHREYAQSNDYYWWESTQEYWVEKLEALGIHTSTKQMFFSGFGNQGDGACFTGSINLRKFLEAHPDLKKEHAKLYMAVVPFDHRGAACEYYDIELTRHGSTNYNHEKSVHLGSWDLNILPELDDEEGEDYERLFVWDLNILPELDDEEGEDYERLFVDAEADIEWQCREYMKELYRDLEKGYKSMQSMECFLEEVDYKDFDSDGELT